MTSCGVKFGKTEAGAVWLDPALTSPFRFYQFWFNAEDRDVVTYLKYFTFRTQGEIGELERDTKEHPERREAQRELARDVTGMVHGPDTSRAPSVPLRCCSADRWRSDRRRHPDGLRRCAVDFHFGVRLWKVESAPRISPSGGVGRVERGSRPADQTGRTLRERPAPC